MLILLPLFTFLTIYIFPFRSLLLLYLLYTILIKYTCCPSLFFYFPFLYLPFLTLLSLYYTINLPFNIYYVFYKYYYLTPTLLLLYLYTLLLFSSLVTFSFFTVTLSLYLSILPFILSIFF